MPAQTPTAGPALTEPPLTEPAVRERLRELPPSAKLVARVLAEDGPLALGPLAEQTLLATSTVRYALTRLEDADLVATRPSLQDPNKQVYGLQP